MSAIKSLKVNLGPRSYPILVGAGLLTEAGSRLSRAGFSTRPLVVTNSTVLGLHGKALLDSLSSAYGSVRVIRIGDGERFKELPTLWKIYRGLFRAHADRRSWVIAFGGGVTGDIAGFAAATFMRGIAYVSIPTTLLAQVDSSVGGKVGINVPQGKNLIGAFHQPSFVISDTGVLETLPRRELAAGLYEVIKCAAIRSEALFGFIESHLPDLLACRPGALQDVILEAVRIKADVVAQDEVESHLRMILNFGHTVGHALEASTGYRRFKHGEAVAWGMIAAAGYSVRQGLLSPGEAERLATLIHRVEKLPSIARIPFQDLWAALGRDKKMRSGHIRMVLLPCLGESMIAGKVDREDLKRYLQMFLKAEGRVLD